MLKLRVAALCKEKVIAHPYTALTEAGISVTKTIQYLRGKTNRVMVDDMEIMCRLFTCTPNDLFEWIPSGKAEDYPENPLQAIAKKPVINMEEIVKNMTVGQVREFVEMLKKMGKL